ncbi:jmjC domain-containing protein 4-like isoform X1 [Tripterygium wilfordii]|uniref:JmjC domain-containing protein 4-like isoform X1 n=3 Tax=Tripterygium wilfordii TaxID=458696 RepID=A0A7J7CDD4_TRIWF|nr:jmjC domain-containing protein 4-like isoform X1 [Tripterygium wilfordii]
MKSHVYNIFDDVSETKFPGFKKAIWLECTQERGEIIFVPSGWFHQVHNLEDTVSINHNWFNGYNLSWVWDLLLRDYNEAKEYIEDIRDICDDFEGLCQRNLAANTGMNFYDFFIFLTRFFLANTFQLYNLPEAYSDSVWNLPPVVHTFVLNLVYIRKIASRMKSVGVLAGNDSLCLDVRKTLDDPLFLEMSMDLSRTYGMIHEEQNLIGYPRNALVDFGEFNYCICNPEDLVKFMDYAVVKLSGNCSKGSILLHELDDTFPLCQS